MPNKDYDLFGYDIIRLKFIGKNVKKLIKNNEK